MEVQWCYVGVDVDFVGYVVDSEVFLLFQVWSIDVVQVGYFDGVRVFFGSYVLGVC